MPKVDVTDRDTTLMNSVAKVLPKTSAILHYFHVGRNVRAEIITYCRVKPKAVKVDRKYKILNEVKPNEIVDTIFRAWEKVVESPTQESYASNVMQFRDVCKKIPKIIDYVQSTILDTIKENIVRAWTDRVASWVKNHHQS